MDLSFLKALIASTKPQLLGLKKQAKRLKDAAPALFGIEPPLSVCQEAVARMNGYRSWQEVAALLSRVGIDRDLPYWTIRDRNDTHQAALAILHELELETRYDRPVVFLGEHRDATLHAFNLLSEEMSFMKHPGLVLVETDAPTANDTALWSAAEQLGLTDILSRHRFLDLRLPTVDVSISVAGRHWWFALQGGLSHDQLKKTQSSPIPAMVEQAMKYFADQRGEDTSHESPISSDHLEYAGLYLKNPSSFGSNIRGTAGYSWHEVEREIEYSDNELRSTVADVLLATYKKSASRGISMEHETRYRPSVVLFNRDDVGSVVLAGAIHAMYHWRYVKTRDYRPVLFYSDRGSDWVPAFLLTGTRVIIVNGSRSLEEATGVNVLFKEMVIAEAGDGWLAARGKRAFLSEK